MTDPRSEATDLLAREVVSSGAMRRAVATMLDDPEVTLADERIEPLGHEPISPASGGLWRIRGRARTGQGWTAWSMVLKAVARSDSGDPRIDDPQHHDYWRREAALNASGLLDRLAPGFRAARVFGVDERGAGRFWLWFEDLGDAATVRWSTDRFAQAARHLALFNGPYATGRELPHARELSIGTELRWTPAEPDPMLSRAEADLEGSGLWPRVAGSDVDAVPGAQDLARFFRSLRPVVTTLDHVPRVLCHNDAGRSNLASVATDHGATETIAIDWALTGIGPLGGEIAQLVIGSAFFGDLPVRQVAEVERVVFEAYVEGLREVGWQGSRRDVRLGYAAVSVLRWGLLLPLWLRASTEPDGRAALESMLHGRAADIVARLLDLMPHLGLLADEVLRMLPSSRGTQANPLGPVRRYGYDRSNEA